MSDLEAQDSITITLSRETLLTLAQGAEYMAAESYPANRGGRCSAYLYEAANVARKALEANHE
jgi:hypothetical protein